MKNIALKIIALVALLLVLVVVMAMRAVQPVLTPSAPVEDYVPSQVTPQATPAPTPKATPEPTPEPEPEYFTLSFVGDCTLTSHQHTDDYKIKMNGDYAYPFSNTVEYFENDEYTFANLECTFSDVALYSYQTFYFRAPSEWANILVEGGVDFVTTANNHTLDFGSVGADKTYAALEAVGVPYGKEKESKIITTPNGLKIGIYCDYNDFFPTEEESVAAVKQLKADGADYIVCAMHWGYEGTYRQDQKQEKVARACIDAGADVIYGSHPHVLQPIEEYNGGIILYSMGNWSFGGNTQPRDRDTAIVQISVKRDADGSLSTEGFEIIPCCLSSIPTYNDYRPIPYEEGSEEYNRVMSKLDGTFDGPNLNVDYSNWHASHP